MPRERPVEVLLRGGGFEAGMSVSALVHGSCQDAWVWHKVTPLRPDLLRAELAALAAWEPA